MLKSAEAARYACEVITKKIGAELPEDARPEGSGQPVCAIGIRGRKPEGQTLLVEDTTVHAPVAELAVTLEELEAMRNLVQGRESLTETTGRVVGVCKVVTPFRWSHEAGQGPYNTLPGHSFSSPSKEDDSGRGGGRIPPGDRSLNSVIFP